MAFANRFHLLIAFLVLILFSQASKAVIISSYTGLYEDGTKFVVDLKGYDYGEGSYFASPTAWNEPPIPPIEGFDTFLYPSLTLQNYDYNYFTPGKMGSTFPDDGLYFEVDKYYGVSLTRFRYLFPGISSGMSEGGIYLYDDEYSTEFSGGFFETYVSPYHVDGPGSLGLLAIGVAGLSWARRFRKE